MPGDTEANGTDKIIHTLDLNDFGMDDVPIEERARVKEEVAIFLKEEILRDVSNGTSPVQGEGRFQRLDSDYAKEKGGGRTSNLELEGDLLNDFFVKKTRGSKVKLGHEGSETPKSDGHNQLSSKARNWAKKSKMPKRRYIPDEGQQFNRKIEDGITKIVEASSKTERERRRADTETEEVEVSVSPDTVETGQTNNILDNTSVSFEELFSDESIDNFFSNALARRGRG